MPKTGFNIYKRKDGRYEGRYSFINEFGEKKYKSVYSSTFEDTKEKLEAIKQAKEEETKKMLRNLNSTFEEMATQWLEIKKSEVRINSYCQYEMNIRNHLLPTLGQLKIHDITSTTKNKFIKELENRNLSNRTKGGIINLLNSIIDYAKVIEETKRWDNENKTEISIISDHNLKIFHNFLTTNVDETKLGILFVLYTGIRIGELCGLRWEDINFETGELNINKTIQRISYTSDEEINKTRLINMGIKPRIVPLPKEFLDILKRFQGKKHYYILTASCTSSEPRTIQYRLNSYTKKAKVPRTTFSDLRHNFAIKALNAGININVLSSILGIGLESLLKYFPYVKPNLTTSEEMQKINGIY